MRFHFPVSIRRPRTGGWLIRHALEKLKIQTVMGIPGVQNTDLYDQLSRSKSITPILVSHELSGAYIADAISRTSTQQIGVIITVPGAGVTHAASGIGEAYLAGIPMLIIATGTRNDRPYHYQLHDIDQQSLLGPITKCRFHANSHADVIPTLHRAHKQCIDNLQGPVVVEIPANIVMFSGPVISVQPAQSTALRALPAPQPPQINENTEDTEKTSTAALPAPIQRTNTKLALIKPINSPKPSSVQSESSRNIKLNLAVDMLLNAKQPGLYLGWGARHANKETIELAERLYAPVATTLQGLSVFPYDHPLHTGMGFGGCAILPANRAFEECDCLIAIGTRFSELSTASYTLPVPEKLIHIDLDPEVFNKNFPATFCLDGDAKIVTTELLSLLRQLNPGRLFNKKHPLVAQIAKDKAIHIREWMNHTGNPERVNPALFFKMLDSVLPREAIIATDDGHHTFLTAELMPIYKSTHFISPTDFNSMGYCVPAVIGAKLANPNLLVAGIVGDGAFRMTCMEITTAVTLKLGCIWFVFNDGELTQIKHLQKALYRNAPCSQLPNIDLQHLALALKVDFLRIEKNSECITVINKAVKKAEANRPVIIDVAIDNSRASQFTRGLLDSQFKKLSVSEKSRAISRHLMRRIGL